MPNIRELEDLIIDAIYLDVLRGKLDQSKELFEVEYTMGRDLEPGKLENILVALQNWYVASRNVLLPLTSLSYRAATTSSVLVTLDSKIETIAAQTAAKRASQEEHDAALQAVLKEVTDRKDKGGHRKGTIDRDSMLMDVDDILEQAKGKNRKSVTTSFLQSFWLIRGRFFKHDRASQEAAPKQQRKRNKF